MFHGFLPLLLPIFCTLFDVIGASYVFDAYRCIQYDKGTSELGCRKTYLSSTAVAFQSHLHGSTYSSSKICFSNIMSTLTNKALSFKVVSGNQIKAAPQPSRGVVRFTLYQ
eukprot:NODE_4908_length_745_cov_18.133621_g4552_i0.p1 GENE.NODE_4908_length_745_cov_18.133621_g4552_i0~~NODE_4908_length_745_cov_18.133621_g4552_i0.p1  ORF type:complete len:111 (+),score=7.20 NODE_4908_length_745_cov_18.133621_g4552_i0:61-393(+)